MRLSSFKSRWTSSLRQIRLRRTLRYAHLRLTRLKSSPAAIARGFAAGTLTGMMPLFGVQTIFAIALATFLKGNPFAAALTTWVSNPITFVPLYMLNFKVGQQLLGTKDLMLMLEPGMSIAEVSRLGLDCLLTLTVGCLAMGLPLAIASYCVGLQLARKWQRDRQSRRTRARLRY